MHKRGRKGKGPPPDAVAGASGRVALLRSATTALLGAAALAADAARLLRWGSAGGGAAVAAGDLVQWTCELAAVAEEGGFLAAHRFNPSLVSISPRNAIAASRDVLRL